VQRITAVTVSRRSRTTGQSLTRRRGSTSMFVTLPTLRTKCGCSRRCSKTLEKKKTDDEEQTPFGIGLDSSFGLQFPRTADWTECADRERLIVFWWYRVGSEFLMKSFNNTGLANTIRTFLFETRPHVLPNNNNEPLEHHREDRHSLRRFVTTTYRQPSRLATSR
jgi:hypothetical protein